MKPSNIDSENIKILIENTKDSNCYERLLYLESFILTNRRRKFGIIKY